MMKNFEFIKLFPYVKLLIFCAHLACDLELWKIVGLVPGLTLPATVSFLHSQSQPLHFPSTPQVDCKTNKNPVKEGRHRFCE
jgi:hypothetical protein